MPTNIIFNDNTLSPPSIVTVKKCFIALTQVKPEKREKLHFLSNNKAWSKVKNVLKYLSHFFG